MDENKVIRPMDFVRLTNIDELNVIKDTKNHIGLVKEVSRDGRMSIIWIGETYSQLAWFKSSELEVVDIQESGDVLGSQGAGRGRIGLGHILYPVLCFLPGDKIEDLTMDETDGFVDTTGIVTSIKSKDVVEFYVENPFVKIKDE